MTQEKEAPYANHPFVTGRRYFVKTPLTDPPFYYFTGFKEGEYITYNSQAHSIYDSCYGFRFWNKDGIGVRIDILEVNSDNINWDEYFEVHPEDKSKPEETKMYGRWIGDYMGWPKEFWKFVKPNNDPPYGNHPFIKDKAYKVRKSLKDSPFVTGSREAAPGEVVRYQRQFDNHEFKRYGLFFLRKDELHISIQIPYDIIDRVDWSEYFETESDEKV